MSRSIAGGVQSFLPFRGLVIRAEPFAPTRVIENLSSPMSMRRIASAIVVLGSVVGVLAPPASAQTTDTAARPLFAAGLALGTATQPSPSYADPQGGRFHSALLATVSPRRWPVEFRGELTWANWASYAGPVGLVANAVVPVGRIALDAEHAALTLRPYAIAGLGVYGVGGVPPRKGHWNLGGGVRLAGARRAVFLEARQLAAYRRTSLAGGFTLGF